MGDEKHQEPEDAAELEIDDLDVDLDLDEAEVEAVKGGSGGEYDNGMQSGGLKHPH
jgi:hypothetical protein